MNTKRILRSLITFFFAGVMLMAAAGNSLAFQAQKDARHDTAVQLARDGDFEQAIRLIEDVIAATDSSISVVGDYIVILSWAGEHQKSADIYSRFSVSHTFPAYVIKQAAFSYRSAGEYKNAISTYKLYIENAPNDNDAVIALKNTYLEYAGILFREGKLTEAETNYWNVLDLERENTTAQIALGRILTKSKKYTEADILFQRVLNKNPANLEALIYMGELFEAQRKYLKAYEHYEEFLRLHPDNQLARNLKYRVLNNLGNYSLAREKLNQTNDKIDPAIEHSLDGNESMVLIRWNEPDAALARLNRNMKEVEDKYKSGTITEKAHRDMVLRIYYDKIQVLKQKVKHEEVLKIHQTLVEMNTDLPAWVLVNIADSYQYMRKPDKAYELFTEALRKNNSGGTKLAIYYALMDLERYDEAYTVLDELDKETPVQIIERGILRDNWRKAEIAFNRGWWLLYQDQLAEGQKYFESIIYRAPFNSHIRSALAHAYMWRGWPRKALEEFEIIRITTPDDVTGEIGYCYALYENDKGMEGAARAKDLARRLPDNKHVRNLNRYYEIQDKFNMSFDSGSMNEDSGVETVYWSTRIEKPLSYWRKIYSEFIWRDISQLTLQDKQSRGALGVDWRLNRDWWLSTGVSAEDDGTEFGYSGQVSYNPNDYWSFSTFYNHYSTTVPLRAKVRGVEAKELRFNTRYRPSERFSIDGGVSLYKISDGNNQLSYILRSDKAITTAAKWKTRVQFEGYAGTNSLQGVPYFSPEYIMSGYLIPSVEHAWYRKYGKSVVDRFFVGIGIQKQKDIPAQDVWYFQYQQDYTLSDLFSFSLTGGFYHRNYDGGDTDVWSFSIRLNQKF